MTKNVGLNFTHIRNYKKAREQVLDHIKQNRPSVDKAPDADLFLS